MGCDIHAHIEIKGPDNKWHKADPFVPNLFEKGKFVQGTELPIDRNCQPLLTKVRSILPKKYQ